MSSEFCNTICIKAKNEHTAYLTILIRSNMQSYCFKSNTGLHLRNCRPYITHGHYVMYCHTQDGICWKVPEDSRKTRIELDGKLWKRMKEDRRRWKVPERP